MEYPAGVSTVDWGVGSRIHPAPEWRGYSPRYYNYRGLIHQLFLNGEGGLVRMASEIIGV